MIYRFSSGEEFVAESPVSVYDAAAGAGIISREILCARVNGEVVDMTYVPQGDCDVKLLTFADPEDDGARRTFRHTASHILAEAVKRLYPEAKLTIGPAIDDGFYYDFDSEVSFTPEILDQIEAEMKKIVKENQKLERFTLPRDEAKKLMEEKGEPYKVLLIDRVPEGEEISFYKMGDFVDLCAGPHLFATGAVKALKLTSCTGAYWEGKSENKMLQRVYGTAFPSKTEMNDFLAAREEARKRDHNKIGRELELFTTVDEIGQGLPILMPKGARIIQRLQRWIEDEEEKRGYLLTKTPLMAKRELYKIQQECFKFFVRLVDFVDEQHHRLFRPDGFQQGPLQQVFVGEQAPGQSILILGIHIHLDGQQLFLVVPLVECLAFVQAFIALQSYQIPVQGGSHHLGHLGLTNTGSALDQQRPSQFQCHRQNSGQGLIINIMGFVHFLL